METIKGFRIYVSKSKDKIAENPSKKPYNAEYSVNP